MQAFAEDFSSHLYRQEEELRALRLEHARKRTEQDQRGGALEDELFRDEEQAYHVDFDLNPFATTGSSGEFGASTSSAGHAQHEDADAPAKMSTSVWTRKSALLAACEERLADAEEEGNTLLVEKQTLQKKLAAGAKEADRQERLATSLRPRVAHQRRERRVLTRLLGQAQHHRAFAVTLLDMFSVMSSTTASTAVDVPPSANVEPGGVVSPQQTVGVDLSATAGSSDAKVVQHVQQLAEWIAEFLDNREARHGGTMVRTSTGREGSMLGTNLIQDFYLSADRERVFHLVLRLGRPHNSGAAGGRRVGTRKTSSTTISSINSPKRESSEQKRQLAYWSRFSEDLEKFLLAVSAGGRGRRAAQYLVSPLRPVTLVDAVCLDHHSDAAFGLSFSGEPPWSSVRAEFSHVATNANKNSRNTWAARVGLFRGTAAANGATFLLALGPEAVLSGRAGGGRVSGRSRASRFSSGGAPSLGPEDDDQAEATDEDVEKELQLTQCVFLRKAQLARTLLQDRPLRMVFVSDWDRRRLTRSTLRELLSNSFFANIHLVNPQNAILLLEEERERLRVALKWSIGDAAEAQAEILREHVASMTSSASLVDDAMLGKEQVHQHDDASSVMTNLSEELVLGAQQIQKLFRVVTEGIPNQMNIASVLTLLATFSGDTGAESGGPSQHAATASNFSLGLAQASQHNKRHFSFSNRDYKHLFDDSTGADNVAAASSLKRREVRFEDEFVPLVAQLLHEAGIGDPFCKVHLQETFSVLRDFFRSSAAPRVQEDVLYENFVAALRAFSIKKKLDTPLLQVVTACVL
ncbi:unnamed protein product [Amoebophrya sp. A120]|nr:unnamed protein product [Amoebophrya sp. A120]|eukprot:GSA120T00017942001.1